MSISVVKPLMLMLRNARLLKQSVKIDIKQRYAGSALGGMWLVVGPVSLMALYALVYVVIFSLTPKSMNQSTYIVYILCGLVPFLSFAQGLSLGSVSLRGRRELLMNTVFPVELIPVRAVLVSQVPCVVGLGVLFTAALLTGGLHPVAALAPLVLIFMILFLLGVVWVLSLCSLVLPDIQHSLQYVVIILLVTSPIAYTPDMLNDGLQLIVYLNPLSYYVRSLQYLIALGEIPPTHLWVGAVVLGGGIFGIGFHLFQRAKVPFFNYS